MHHRSRNLFELGECQPKVSHEDGKLGDQLTDEKQYELKGSENVGAAFSSKAV